MINLLIEGSSQIKHSSEFQFWTLLNQQLLNNELNIIPCDGVLNLINKAKEFKNSSEKVIINIDKCSSNPDRVIRLSLEVRDCPNIFVSNYVCFEDIFIQFTYLLSWIFSVEYRKSKEFHIIEKLVQEYNAFLYKDKEDSPILKKFLDTYNNSNYNVSNEKLAAQLLAYVSYRKSYTEAFTVLKEKLGDCWSTNCKDKSACLLYHKEGQCFVMNKKIKNNKEKLCGLYENKKTVTEKLIELYNFSPIKENIQKARNYLYKRR